MNNDQDIEQQDDQDQASEIAAERLRAIAANPGRVSRMERVSVFKAARAAEGMAKQSNENPWRAKAEQVEKALRVIQANDCVQCHSPSSDVALACQSKREELEGKPFCKHTDTLRGQAALAERTRVRADRLRATGLGEGPAGRQLIADFAPAFDPPRPRRNDAEAEMWRVALDWMQDPRGGILTLVGATGTAKTTVAAWCIAEFGGVLIPADQIVPEPSYYALRKRAKDAELVVLDDLGTETWAEAPAQIRTIVGDRYRTGRRLILTSNLLPTTPVAPPNEMPEQRRIRLLSSIQGRYDDRVHDRIWDRSRGCRVVRCGSVSLRGRG